MGEKNEGVGRLLLRRLAGILVAVLLTAGLFLLLPVMQTISSPPPNDLSLRNVDLANIPPPPPPPVIEEPEPEEPPEEPPKLAEEEAPPLDLSQLELALNPGRGGNMFGDFSVNLMEHLQGNDSEELDQIFSLAELDQRPRVIYQRVPTYPPDLKKQKRRGTVYIVFLVDRKGRVVQPKVERSTDPGFERPALEAVKQWRFEPGTRNGEPVQFKMRVPITFNVA